MDVEEEPADPVELVATLIVVADESMELALLVVDEDTRDSSELESV
jgi:hypothetical protein